MLALAQRDAASSDAYGIAWKLELRLREQWQHQDRRAEDVFKLLRLDQQGDELFKSPVFSTWSSYVDKLDWRNPYESMLSVISARYSDEALAPMLSVAKVEDIPTFVADRLKDVLFKRWMKNGKDADDVFALYQLDKEGDKLFESLGFRSWASYVEGQGRDGAAKAMLNVLRKRYDDETLEKLLLAAKERSSTTIVELRNELWLRQGKPTVQAYLLLQLDTLGEHVLFSPDLSPLVSYAKKVAGKVDEKSGVSDVVSLLAGQFGDEITLARKLSVVISLNMGTSRDSAVLYELQKLLFTRWLEKGVKPSDITGRLVTSFDKGYGVLNEYQRFYRTNMAKAGK